MFPGPTFQSLTGDKNRLRNFVCVRTTNVGKRARSIFFRKYAVALMNLGIGGGLPFIFQAKGGRGINCASSPNNTYGFLQREGATVL